MSRPSTVGVAILVLNGAQELRRLLPILAAEPGIESIVVIDSESSDDSERVATSVPGVRFRRIARRDFNHGGTRELARRELGTDIAVLLTQDVIPQPGFIAPLVAPLREGRAAVSYARQLPHEGADFFEAFPREFNYPAESQLRSLADAKGHGVYTFFCSDSCAAYVNSELTAIGGFRPVLTNEDYFAVAELLRAGNRIAYVAESCVRHSHRYTLRQEFERYFDTGYVRAERPWVNALVGRAERRGGAFAGAMLRALARQAPVLIPYAILQTAIKWVAYRVGFWAQRLRWSPRWCERLSSQKYYWRSSYCGAGVDNEHEPKP